MHSKSRLSIFGLSACAIALLISGSTYAAQSPATSSAEDYAEYRNDRWGFSLAVPADMTVGEYDQSYGGQEFTFSDASGEKQFVISVAPYEQLDLTLNYLQDPSTADQPSHLEIVNVLREETFKVWFTKNGVLYVVVALDEQEAWLTHLLKSWQFI